MPGDAEVTDQEQREASAEQAGRAWCVAVRSTLREAGRAAAGGWPGTISEARARLVGTLGPGAGLSVEDSVWLAHVLYGAARKSWLGSQEPLEPEG